ncbi:MAG: prolyl oligopeptidase family serine peptidase [Candidatus Acidiferrales bacterium]
MLTRREAVRRMGSASAGALLAAAYPNLVLSPVSDAAAAIGDSAPPLAPGTPRSPDRLALIEAFKKQTEGLEKKFEARTHKADWEMPYRLFRPSATGKVPLVMYLHGSGGLGNDNLKQMGLGNIFGTRVWALVGNQEQFPCYVVAPQTDRGWNRYDFSQLPEKPIPGFGEGARMALEIVDALCREFAIDEKRIYVTGQSMGGAGTWNVITNRPNFFAAAVPCCGSISFDDGTGSISTPLWNFHGDSDRTVPASVSRERIAARRKAGGRPLSTEYPGVDHNVWEWAYTEPSLVTWLFSQSRGQ